MQFSHLFPPSFLTTLSTSTKTTIFHNPKNTYSSTIQKNQMIPSNPKITHIISTTIEKSNLPCFSPVFPTPPNITFQQNKNMSTTSSVTQNFQSCLDPLSFEQLTPSKQSPSFPWPQKQADFENTKTEQIYVHPLVKRSSSSLSTKSLEMCTESLGSETGNCIDSIVDEKFSLYTLEKQSNCKIKPVKNLESTKKINKNTNFPPPLTSISGNGGVQVQTHREGGRLVIKAFNFSSRRNYFRAERENGRLRLSLIKDGFRDSEHELGDDHEEDEEIAREKVENIEGNCCDESDDEVDYNGRYDGGKIGCKMNGGDWSGIRCNGDRSGRSKRLPSLPFCVAIS